MTEAAAAARRLGVVDVTDDNSLRVEFTGVRETLAALGKLEPGIPRAITAANRNIATRLARRARQEAPVGPTGNLARSIRASASRTAVVVKAGNTAVPYAGAIHWGWPKRNIEPNRFLSRVAARTRDELRSTYAAEVERQIRKAGF